MLPQYQMSTPCFCSAINTGGSALKITCLMVDADYVRSRRTSIRVKISIVQKEPGDIAWENSALFLREKK